MIGHLQQLKLDIPTQRSKQMVDLGADCVSGRAFQRSVLLEGLMILFHVPPSVVDCGDLVEGACHIRAHQILGGLATIFVYEELLGQYQGEVYSFKIDCPYLANLTRFQRHTVHTNVSTLLLTCCR